MGGEQLARAFHTSYKVGRELLPVKKEIEK